MFKTTYMIQNGLKWLITAEFALNALNYKNGLKWIDRALKNFERLEFNFKMAQNGYIALKMNQNGFKLLKMIKKAFLKTLNGLKWIKTA